MTSSQIRVLIADDDLFVRESLTDYLTIAPEVVLVGTCRDGAEAVAMAAQTTPDVVLMDIQMPGMDGVRATREITQHNEKVRVVALTSFADDELIAAMLAAGAVSYLLKSTRPAVLVDAIRAAHRGLTILPAQTVSRWAAEHGRGAADRPELTERERQVLRLVADGLNNRQIGQAMYVSTSTVKNLVSALMAKLAVTSRTRLVARAHELGLLAGS